MGLLILKSILLIIVVFALLKPLNWLISRWIESGIAEEARKKGIDIYDLDGDDNELMEFFGFPPIEDTEDEKQEQN